MSPDTPKRRAERPRGEVTEWSVRNFKAIEHASLPLTSLDLILGPNSSGKSSLLQTLLILGQSTEDEINLNGPLVRLGNAADVIRAGENSIALGFTVRERRVENPREVLFEISFVDKSGSLVPSEFVAIDQHTESTLLRASGDRIPKEAREVLQRDHRPHEIILRVCEINDRPALPYTYISFAGLVPVLLAFRRTRAQVFDELKRSIRDKDDVETTFETYYQIADWISSRTPEERVHTSASEQVSNRTNVFNSLLKAPQKVVREDMLKYVNDRYPEKDWIRIPVHSMLPINADALSSRNSFPPLHPDHDSLYGTIAVAADALRVLQRGLRYLGPLREEPQVVSPTGGRIRTLPTGAKGEYTADLLARTRNNRLRYGDWNGKKHDRTLAHALTQWTSYLGLGDSVTVEDQGKLGRGLRIKVNDVERDLTMIGIGASQLIPVVTTVLTAPVRGLVLLEQPELHLHPSVQSRLADFFLHARSDIKLIVETHSEYLITRLRRRVVENPDTRSRVAVLFAEQRNGITEIRRLALDKLGDFSSWPEGFFDTQDSESAALANAVLVAMRKNGK
ncbi:AAA family ATPase [Nocardia wallacei]|uniref:AAA family ATPase n=1 Tax=Nocardia wallacei TaxID=480035 RepID=UPI002453DDC3|nr:DUF3696 domain-containing protein [Nocardia wallacei]